MSISKSLRRTAIGVVLGFFVAPALADNCSGEFTFQGTGGGPADIATGKITHWTSSSTVSSSDTPYNGAGTCSGYTYERDGKVYGADVCVRVTADGDSWGVIGRTEPGNKRGEWRALFGTGKLAKNAGSVGWFEVVSADDKGGRGIWGGNCLGVK